jgi:nitric oxide reductase subunit B
MIGGTLFAVGVAAFGWFVLGLKTGWSVTGEVDAALESGAAPRPSVAQAQSES